MPTIHQREKGIKNVVKTLVLSTALIGALISSGFASAQPSAAKMTKMPIYVYASSKEIAMNTSREFIAKARQAKQADKTIFIGSIDDKNATKQGKGQLYRCFQLQGKYMCLLFPESDNR